MKVGPSQNPLVNLGPSPEVPDGGMRAGAAVAPKKARTAATRVSGTEIPVQTGDSAATVITSATLDSTVVEKVAKNAAGDPTGSTVKGAQFSALARAEGVVRPAIVAKPADVLSRLLDGDLKLSVPLAARDVGKVTIPPGTSADLELMVEDGELKFD